MTRISLPKLTFWRVVGTLLMLSALAAGIYRFTHGLGAATHLSDEFPWGLWIGFDILCGVGLAAGGFTLCGIVYIFNIKRLHPITRPAVLTAFLGYLLVIFALMFDLGRPIQIWHAIIMWNPHSVMFEVAWCVMLYTTVLALEFSPIVFERFKMKKTLKVMRAVTIPLVIAGVLLSTLHQSSLGSLYLIVPNKLHPFWYSPMLPVFFFISALTIGGAMTIVESYFSSRAFHRALETPLLRDLARLIVAGLIVYATAKALDYGHRGLLGQLFVPSFEMWMLWLEFALFIIIPLILFNIPKVLHSPTGLFIGAMSAVLGFVTNRLNVSLTGMESYLRAGYFPSIMEIAVTAGIVALGFWLFSLAARYLPIFTHAEPGGEVVHLDVQAIPPAHFAGADVRAEAGRA